MHFLTLSASLSVPPDKLISGYIPIGYYAKRLVPDLDPNKMVFFTINPLLELPKKTTRGSSLYTVNVPYFEATDRLDRSRPGIPTAQLTIQGECYTFRSKNHDAYEMPFGT